MNIPQRKGVLFWATVVLFLLVCCECFPARTKKGGRHRHIIPSHRRHRGNHGKVSTAKKDSVNQQVIAAVMQPGKLDVSDERDLDQFQDFNKAFINNEMAAETSLLANQGIDDDSALRISNMAALPGLPGGHTASKTKINDNKGDVVPITKPFVAGYSPDEYLLDANSWPEYRIKDSDYYNKNYRVFPHGQQDGNYQGGMLGGGMSYGQRVADGMEGPYGDGNYGFGGGPQMVSDEPSHAATPNPQDEGSQITMSPSSMRIQKLVIKHQKKLKDPTKVNFGDEMSNSSQAEGSGSADSSGSGQFFSQIGSKSTNSGAQGKQAGDVNTAKEESGQVTVDTKPEGPAVSTKTTEDAPSKSEQQVNTVSTSDQSHSSNASSNKDSHASSTEDSHASKQESTGSKQDSNANTQETSSARQDNKTTQNNATPQEGGADQAKANQSDSHNSPLKEFAKFLKAKGITLTINKEKSSKTESEPDQSEMKPQSSSPAVVPPSGEANEPSQEASLNNAVMTWQNVAPQANPVGGLFLRHDTKQQTHH